MKSSFHANLFSPIGPHVGAPGIESVYLRRPGVKANRGIFSSKVRDKSKTLPCDIRAAASSTLCEPSLFMAPNSSCSPHSEGHHFSGKIWPVVLSPSAAKEKQAKKIVLRSLIAATSNLVQFSSKGLKATAFISINKSG